MGELKLSNIRYSCEEYFAIDTKNEERHEYENGEIWAMAGTSIPHNRIIHNLVVAFRMDIKMNRKNCNISTENIRLEVIPQKVYYYPDLIFTCDAQDLQENMMIKNASLVIEVVSEGSFLMDLSRKMDNYMQMESLKYYLTIEQTECRVRCLEKINDQWIYAIYRNITDIIPLPQIEMELSVAEIYENIVFTK